MSADNLQTRLDAINARSAEKRKRHRQDVRYVQETFPNVARVLTEFIEAFGKAEVDYRVTLKCNAR